MTDLPRSRALVRLDGPGHIMPVEPVTPPNSRVWQFLHRPLVLALVASTLLAIAAMALDLLGIGLRFVSFVPGVRFLVPVIGAAAVGAAYLVFTRLVERRPCVEELGGEAWVAELAVGYSTGLALSLATFAILALLGYLRVVGLNPARVLLLPFVVQFCTAVILEIIVCGIGFRLLELWLGSWLALVATIVFFGAVRALGEDASDLAIVAVGLEAGLLFAAFYMVTRRLWAAIGLHAAWRFAQIALYGVATSETGPHGLLLTNVEGAAWITGGRAGTDASGPAVLVSAITTVALLAAAVRRGRIVRPVWQRGRKR